MNDRIKAAVLGSFVADALALGVHWVYNTRVIDKKFGRIDGYLDPLTSYHKGKKAGDQTHYGDQMLVLMESLEKDSTFDLEIFASRWRRFFDTYTGYFDHATQDTLHNLLSGKDFETCGSLSEDLGGACRIAPLVPVFEDDPEKLVAAARKQTALTHNNADVLAAAEFFSRTTATVLAGAKPLQAVDTVLDRHFKASSIETLVMEGLDSRAMDTRQTIADFGQACSVEVALPGVVHIIARYTDNFEGALVENIMAGGDSAARGIPAAMILGAHHGLEAIPGKWLDGLASRERVEQFLKGR